MAEQNDDGNLVMAMLSRVLELNGAQQRLSRWKEYVKNRWGIHERGCDELIWAASNNQMSSGDGDHHERYFISDQFEERRAREFINKRLENKAGLSDDEKNGAVVAFVLKGAKYRNDLSDKEALDGLVATSMLVKRLRELIEAEKLVSDEFIELLPLGFSGLIEHYVFGGGEILPGDREQVNICVNSLVGMARSKGARVKENAYLGPAIPSKTKTVSSAQHFGTIPLAANDPTIAFQMLMRCAREKIKKLMQDAAGIGISQEQCLILIGALQDRHGAGNTRDALEPNSGFLQQLAKDRADSQDKINEILNSIKELETLHALVDNYLEGIKTEFAAAGDPYAEPVNIMAVQTSREEIIQEINSFLGDDDNGQGGHLHRITHAMALAEQDIIAQQAKDSVRSR